MPPQILEATPEKQPDGTIKWTLCHVQGTNKTCGNEPAKYPPVPVNSNGKQPFKITIKGDQTGLGIKYAPDPLWAQWNATKPAEGWPQKPSGPDGGQLIDIKGSGTQELTFRDTNTKQGTITYQLNFVDQTNQPVTPLDPEIKNGGQGFTQDNFLANQSTGTILLLAVLLVVIGGFIGALVGKRFG